MRVYIILGIHWTKQMVLKEIKEEGYPHYFFFPDGVSVKERLQKMNEADEIWCFGNCTGHDDYIIAKEKGYDVWQMV